MKLHSWKRIVCFCVRYHGNIDFPLTPSTDGSNIFLMQLILIFARIRRFILFLRILIRLWRSKDFPALEVPKSDSSKVSSVLSQESAPTVLSILLLDSE